MPFIIDGYNLLHSIHKANEDSDAISDAQLCRIVDIFLTQTSQKGEIIFDGAGPPDKNRFDNMRKLEVFFAGVGRDADTVIECKIKASTAPKGLTVVSSDRKLRDAARRRKATVVKSEVFWDNLQRQLSRKKTSHEPAAKRRGLSEGETDQWLRIFGLDK
jgi:predicted RNA-binding protein with PIN domain